jgi:hypothetical protein
MDRIVKVKNAIVQVAGCINIATQIHINANVKEIGRGIIAIPVLKIIMELIAKQNAQPAIITEHVIKQQVHVFVQDIFLKVVIAKIVKLAGDPRVVAQFSVTPVFAEHIGLVHVRRTEPVCVKIIIPALNAK